MSRELPLTEVKTDFPNIVKGVEMREEEIIVTRNGRPAAVILNYHEFRRYKETVDTLLDRDLMKQIARSKTYYQKRKKGASFEDIFAEPLKKARR